MPEPLDNHPKKPAEWRLFIGKTLWLCLLYTGALVLIVSALDAHKDPSGPTQINFAYKVF